MKRRNIVDNEHKVVGWFNEDTAHEFAEDTYFDGHNMISKATRSQWSHETLYLTKSGKWVLNYCGNGNTDYYRQVGIEEAATWLLTNDEITNDLPKEILDIVKGLEV